MKEYVVITETGKRVWMEASILRETRGDGRTLTIKDDNGICIAEFWNPQGWVRKDKLVEEP